MLGFSLVYIVATVFFFFEFQAALDGHFGIWTVASLDTDQKGSFKFVVNCHH